MSNVTITFAETTMDQSVEVLRYGLDDGGMMVRFPEGSKLADQLWGPPYLAFVDVRFLTRRCLRLGREADHLSIVPKLRMGGAISFLPPPCAFMSRKGTTFLVA
jgi:hypothetical protein